MKYSVLMSVYIKEKPEYMRIAVDSMLEQTQKPDQIVLVKDGPLTSELEALISEYQKALPHVFTVVSNERNVGLGKALNIGTKHCRNELIARMDTDDISLPQRCEKEINEFLSDPELDIVGTMCSDFIDDPSNIISTRIVPTDQAEIYNFGKRRSPFNHISVMFKKITVEKFDGYSDLRRNQDADLFGRMMYGGCRAKNLNEVLVLARMTDTRKKRRKNWSNVIGNIKIVNNFRRIGYASLSDNIIVAIAQIGLFLCPVQLQQLLFKVFLRK